MDIVWVILGSFFNVVLGILVGATVVRKMEESRERNLTTRKRVAAERAKQRLEALETEYQHDPAEMHSRADGVLCGLLCDLGHMDAVDAYEKILELR